MSGERLYYEDGYTTEFEGTVRSAWRDEEGRTRVVLESTYFYPTSGGQMHDRGVLGGGRVVDVTDENGVVVHVIEGLDPPPEGARLGGEIDAQRRRHHRQQHTGQHVLSRVVEDRLGLPTASSRLGETGNTLDLEVASIAASDLDAVEDETNRIVWEGRPVHVRFLAPEEASEAELRKIPHRQGRLRVIEVDGHDRSACGGTHVRNTSEIGLVAITRLEKIKGGQRIHFLCGDRALRYRRERDRLVSRLGSALTTGADGLLDAVRNLQAEAKSGSKKVTALQKELLLSRSRAWLDAAPRTGGTRLVRQTLESEAAPVVGEVLQSLTKQDRVVVLLDLRDGSRTQVLLGRSGELELDCARLLRKILEPLGGKGGGQPHTARGSFPGHDMTPVEEEVAAALSSL